MPTTAMWAVLLRVDLIPSPGGAEGTKIGDEKGVREQCRLFSAGDGDS